MRFNMGVPAVILAAVMFAVGCRKSEYTAQQGDTSATAAQSTPAATAPTAATSTATATSVALTDANIVYILDQANAVDSARGALAATKATSTDVKNFGKLMMGEHHALRAEGQKLATKLGVTPQAPAGDQSQAQAEQELDSLNAMPKGPAWDRAYTDYEVTYHKAVIDVANIALGAAQNTQLKALIKQAAPVLQHHLDRAEQIQKKLGA